MQNLKCKPEKVKGLVKVAVTNAELDRVRQLLWQYAEWRGFDAALAKIEAEIELLPGKYAPPEGQLLLALWNDQAAGCIAYQSLSPTICEMKRLFVLPDYRGKQIGQQLIARLLDEARRAGYTHMRLDSHPHMQAAQRLYEHFGFQPTDRYNDNPTEGILFFEKKL